ncbi:MAG: NifB/NifX family molybdenum-iron cluster-binding protein [Deltaproteobacteria bacterium]|nr:NifB/NifX family molybdenum-iron cluster-binding protein [Deltaproteobacteria bacterium]
MALSVWENRISPVFDSARMLLITDLENKVVTGRYYEPFSSEVPMKRAAKLSDLGVKILICGAVSQPLAHMIEGYGIRIIPFVRGKVDQVLRAYLKEVLSTPNFRMPGCKDRDRKRRRSRRGCKNK